jgi:YebC/PmpR family DNA-binding regulatory protein
MTQYSILNKMGRAFEYRKARKFARWGAMSKVFTKIGKEIALSVKGGGTDPTNNPRLRAAIQNAKKANMPKTTVDSAIKKASSKDAENYAEVVYEGYGPHGIAILVETTTDNPTRTVANVRSHFNKCGGAMGTSGSVDYMFTRKGLFRVKKEHISNIEDLELELIDAGLDEIKDEGEEYAIYCNFTDFGSMQKALEEQNIEIDESALERLPNMTKELTEEQVEQVIKLIERLEDDDDVANVFHTMDMSE